MKSYEVGLLYRIQIFTMMNKKAQSINEYAIIIAIVVVAIMSMQVYFKRGIQSIIQDSADQLGTQVEQEYNLNSQMVGISEIGLFEPNYRDPIYTVVNDDTMYSESDITLEESPPDGVNPVREVTINEYEISARKDFERTSVIYGDGHSSSLSVLEP